MINLTNEEKLTLENCQLKYEILKKQSEEVQSKYNTELLSVCAKNGKSASDIESLDIISGTIKFKPEENK